MVFGSVLAMRGWMRWNCDTPLALSTAISPSSTACDAAMWCGITASSGYWRSQRSPLRACRRTSSLSTKATARTPSHFTSKSQSSPRGTRSAIMAFIGSMAAGISASRAPLRLARSYLGFFLAGTGLADAAGCAEARARLAGGLVAQTRSAAPAVSRFVLRAGRLRAISSWVRPESTLYASASTSQPGVANSSRFLMSSHSLPLPLARGFMWTMAKSPFSFSPCRRNFRSPRASCASAATSPSTSNVPRSHSITLPPP